MGEVGWVVDELMALQTPPLFSLGVLAIRKYEIDLAGKKEQEFFLFVGIRRMRAIVLG